MRWQDVESVYSRILRDHILIYKNSYQLPFDIFLANARVAVPT